MELDWYEDFLALAQTGKFTAAARMRDLSQSALSRRIQLLEGKLGATLIDRSSNPVRLTAAGESLKTHAAELVRVARSCAQSVQVSQRPLSFGALHTLGCHFFPSWIGRYSRPESPLFTRVDTGYRSTEDYFMALLSGRCDFILLYRDARTHPYAHHSEFEVLSLGRDELFWVATAEVAARCSDATASIPWLTFARTTPQLHDVIERHVNRHPEAPRLKRVFEATISEVIKPLAMGGHGVACLPHSMVAQQLERGELIRLYPDREAEQLEVILVRWRGSRNAEADAFWKRLLDDQQQP